MPPPAPQPATPPDLADLTGKTVGRFAIRARLGAGGMGEVYRAEDTRLKRAVALKRVAPRLQADENYRKRFLREAQCASGLASQYIASVYDVLESNGEIFLVMEYVEGVTLRQQLAQPLSLERFLGIAVQCAAALVAAHELGIVHRDIKPENIMLNSAGQVKILDFGLAKQLPSPDNEVTTESVGSGSFSGTPAYMAPEVLLEREPDRRADIFSLGVVFYEALSGRHPFQAASILATSTRILHDAPVPLRHLNPKVPAELERIVAKMLAKDPTQRYATAADLLVDLRAVEHAVAYPATLPPSALPTPRTKSRSWGLAALTVLAVAGLGLLPQVRQRFNWFGHSAVAGPKNLAVLPFRAIGGAPSPARPASEIPDVLHH
jgi:serine/threonine protein kinase